jgi:hypothetical protein
VPDVGWSAVAGDADWSVVDWSAFASGAATAGVAAPAAMTATVASAVGRARVSFRRREGDMRDRSF